MSNSILGSTLPDLLAGFGEMRREKQGRKGKCRGRRGKGERKGGS